MKKSLVLVMLVCITSCKFLHKNSHVSGTPDVTINLNDKLFYSNTLQDSLVNFLESIDAIPNPWNIDPEFLIQFEQNSSGDTIMLISCAIEFIPANMTKGYSAFLDQEIELLGGLVIDNKPIMIRKQPGITIDHILNTELIDKNVGWQIDSIRQVVRDLNYQWDAPMMRTSKEYIISNKDSLVLMRSFHMGIKTYERLGSNE